MSVYILGFRCELKGFFELGFLLPEPQDTERSHKNVTLCFARVEEISQVAQKVVSQTSFSCLKSQDLSTNRGCAQTDCAIYHLTELGFRFNLCS